jgi:hypothetical protein
LRRVEAGLLNSNIAAGIKVPQQLTGSIFHQVNPRWAVSRRWHCVRKALLQGADEDIENRTKKDL